MRQPRGDEIHGRVGGDVAALELAGSECRVDVGIGVEIDDLNTAEARSLEQLLLGGDVPLAVTQPGLDAHLDVAGFRGGRDVLREGDGRDARKGRRRKARLEDVAAARCPSHVRFFL